MSRAGTSAPGTGSAFADATDAESKVLNLLQLLGEPLLSEELQEKLKLDITVILQAVQQLLDKGSVRLRSADGDKPGQVRVGLTTAAEHVEQQKTKGLQADEKLVYQIIQQAQNKGIWIKDIRMQSNVPQPRLPKILKKLESLNLVKTVKTSASATKKIYMLFELQPSESLTGGTWYTDGSLDENFVEQMRGVCTKLIKSKGDMSLQAITQFVSERGFTSQALQANQIKQVLQTLIYDGTIDLDERFDDPDNPVYSEVVMETPSTTALSSIPCGHCPVLHECCDGNDVSPATCLYMKEWLEF